MAPLSEEERENLVAYLDGELDEETARTIEARINVDPQVRAEAEALKQAWELLDFLPRPEPSGNFTHRTMEALSLNRPVSTMTMPQRQVSAPAGLGLAGWLAIWVLAAAASFALVVGFWPIPSKLSSADTAQLEQILQENPRIIKYHDLYAPIEDMEFLKELDKPDLFGEVIPERSYPPQAEDEAEWKARMYQKAKAFLALSAERKEQLRHLDNDLHRLPLGYRKYLFGVMERYSLWLRRLSSEQRQQLEQIGDKQARLEFIRQLHQDQWIKTLAKVHRDQLAQTEGEDRKKLITQLHQQQLRWQIEWYIIYDHWEKGKKKLPESIDDLNPPEVKNYVKDYLMPLLTEEEKRELQDPKTKWPWFPYLLVKFADEHPLALPSATKWPQRLDHLPGEIQARLGLKKSGGPNQKVLTPLEGTWPDFANKVAELLNRRDPGPLRYEIWPTQFRDLSKPVKDFVDGELRPRLSSAELEKLQMAEGKWPDYPEMIQQLSRQHYLTVPWQSIPGRSLDSYRLKKGPAGEEN